MRIFAAVFRCIGTASMTFLLWSSCTAAEPIGDGDYNPSSLHSTETTSERMRVRDGFVVRLAAAEPDVVDPVSAAWDIDGRLWVVEMPDYPQPAPGQTERHGHIRILSDRDSDGRFRQRVTFADGLDFVTGVLPWQGGAIVTLAGKIVFLRDVNGDGSADAQEVWFEGFTIDNEQLRANHPTLGPDGMVYVAGGLRGGEVMAVDPRFDRKTKPVKLHGRDFAFDPRGGFWGTVSGNSQHGLSIDDFNRRLGCSNRNPAIEPVLHADVIDRDPFLVPGDAISDVGKSGFESEVHPISKAWTTSNLHAGQFSAACGVLAPGRTRDDVSQWLLVCEPTGSLVQRQRLSLLDGRWTSQREAIESEWLACRDDWFRPVDLLPDVGGGVLVVDMTRAVIEHPHWAPTELKKRPDTFHGNDLGRIWQVRPAGSAVKSLVIREDIIAIESLLSAEPIHRMMSSAYWFDRYDDQSPPSQTTLDAISRIVTSQESAAASRARASMILNRWGLLSNELRFSLLGSDNARLRTLVMGLREMNRPGARPILPVDDLIESLDDDSLLVRRAALESIAVSENVSNASHRIHGQLRALAMRDGGDPWMRKVLAALPTELSSELLSKSLQIPNPNFQKQVPTAVLVEWMRRLAAKEGQHALKLLCDRASQASTANGDSNAFDKSKSTRADVIQLAAAFLKGMNATDRTGKIGRLLSDETSGPFSNVDPLAYSIVFDENESVAIRLDALQWIGERPELSMKLRDLVDDRTDASIRAATYRLLLQRDVVWTKQHVLEHGDATSATDRLAIVQAARGNVATATWLLKQIGNENLPRSFVDPASMDWFRNHHDPQMAKLGRETFAPPGDIVKVLNEYASAVSQWETADVAKGKALFAQHCANCHRVDSVGHTFGPDISDSRAKTPESLLSAILDPSAAIDASFAAYQVLTVGGEVVSGLLADETSDTVTLAIPGGESRRIDRDNIELFRSSNHSLMPEGLQRAIDVDQMRDLIAYLKRWRYVAAD